MAPLQGIRVIDLSRVLAGPYCAQLLADQGADVIKVESPGGDENRLWGTRGSNGITCNFNSVNRGKRGITLNLKSPDAQRVLHQLVRGADVVIQSFIPRSAEGLDITYDRMKAIKPDIIFCSVNGYGERGPLRNKPGYDLMMQAFSGVMSTTGFEDGPPIRCGISAIDMSTGMIAFGGIMTALLKRSQGQGGSWVRVSLLETAISLLGYHAVATLQTGQLPRREGSGVWHLVPYQAFRCRDGYLLAGATNDAAWRRFATALGHLELADDERFRNNDGRLAHRAVLVGILEEIFTTRDVADWVERFDAQGVAVSPLHSLDQMLAHPQVKANDMIVEAETADGDTLQLLGSPFKLSGYETTSRRAPPTLGEHTNTVLSQELGLSENEIQQLREAGAL